MDASRHESMSFREGVDRMVDRAALAIGLSPNTTLAYRRDLLKFGRFIGDEDLVNYDRITPDRIVEFMMAEKNDGMAVTSISRNLVAVQMFVRFLVGE